MEVDGHRGGLDWVQCAIPISHTIAVGFGILQFLICIVCICD